MVRRLSAPYFVILVAGVVACADDGEAVDAGAVDGASDGGGAAVPPVIPWLEDSVPPIMLAPCPEGWREVATDAVMECDPYPVGGTETCDGGEAHFPGEAGCRPIGEPCPAGDYAAGLPADGSVIYVNAAASALGDGSLAAPYAGLSGVIWSSLTPGTTVALAKGAYEGTIHVKGGVRVVGACVRDTRLTGYSGPIPNVVGALAGAGVALVQNLTVAGASQRGVLVDGGRSLSLEGVLIEGARGAAVTAVDLGTVVTLRDTVIRDTQPRAGDAQYGRGIDVVFGAQLTATRLLVSRSHEIGVSGYGGGTVIALTDAVIRDTLPEASDDTFGRGIALEEGAQLTATRLLVSANHDLGLFVFGEGTRATLTDVIVRDTIPQGSDGAYGRGLDVEGGGELIATRLLVAGNTSTGLYVARDGTAVTLTDAVIRDTQPQRNDSTGGRGINVQGGASLDATRLLVSRSHAISLYVGGDRTAVKLMDAAFRQTDARASDGTGGRGINVETLAILDGDRVVVEDSMELGIASSGGATATLRDVSIVGTSRSSCASTTCPDEAHGHGATVVTATLGLTRFQVRDAETCGVFIGESPRSVWPTALEVETGLVAGSAIGVCIQVPDFDLELLQNGVEYRDNSTNLDTTTLPVPEPVDAVGG